MEKTEINVSKMIDELVQNARVAADEFLELDQAKINEITGAMALTAMNNRVRLAKMACEETSRGVFEDKIIKNMFASEYVWNSIKDKKTVGVISENEAEGRTEIAAPLGVVAAVTPVTNPTSTAIFKALICMKTCNAIIFGFHPGAQKCSVETAKLLRDVAIEHGAPKNCIQWIEYPSVEATTKLMNHSGVDMILATGGSGMVKSAYSTGNPALGVGPGNVPCYIEKSADIERACNDLILSKTFDNGMICASEQAVIVDEEIANDFETVMIKNGCYFTSEEEIKKLTSYMINPEKITLNASVAGKSAFEIAENSGFSVPKNTKILLAELKGVGKDFPLSIEKLSPVLSYYKSKNSRNAFDICKKVLKNGGEGHTAVIHTKNDEIVKKFGIQMNAGRILVNTPSSHGAIGDIYNTATPSLTLGCGSWGKNSTADNISVGNLINIKKVFRRKNNMQWFKIPQKIYFEKGSISYLTDMENANRVFVVTDKNMIKLGNIEKLTQCLDNRKENCKYEIFSDVSPDPDIETVWNGLKIMRNFEPDCVVALGGGSVIDAAKAMWMFYEYPNLDFEGLKLKFMDIRKRIYKYPSSHKIPLVAVPTTSGTGSEVTSFAVITDKKEDVKYPLADYFLTPSVSIVDSQFVESLPKVPTADTGMDVLTHAIEAYVSVMASDYTDALALRAFKMVVDYLPRAYESGESDSEAREKMHDASSLAGMAFTNAFLGLNHSMAHKLGGEFHISHGRANAMLLPYVIEYNSSLPTRFAAFPKYEKFIADKKYAQLAALAGKEGSTTQESVQNLIEAIKNMNKYLGIPLTLKNYGIPEEEFLQSVDKLSELAHEDQCTGTNPRYPLVSEIKEIYLKCYYGK